MSVVGQRVHGVVRGARRRIHEDVELLPRFLRSLDAIRRTLILADLPETRVSWLDGAAGVTNPSIAVVEDGMLVVARTVPYRLSRLHRRGVPLPDAPAERTVVYRPGGSGVPAVVEPPTSTARRVYEDPRVFFWRGSTWAIWTSSTEVPGGSHRNAMVLGRLGATAMEDLVEISSPVGSDREKNWMPLVRDDRLYFMYDLGRGLVYEYVGDGRLVAVGDPGPSALDGESGSSQFIPCEQGWIGVSHRRIDRPFLLFWLPVAYYRHRFVLLDRNLEVGGFSDPFFLTKRDVEFCAGIAHEGEDLVLSFGVEDARAAMLRLPVSRVRALLSSGVAA